MEHETEYNDHGPGVVAQIKIGRTHAAKKMREFSLGLRPKLGSPEPIPKTWKSLAFSSFL